MINFKRQKINTKPQYLASKSTTFVLMGFPHMIANRTKINISFLFIFHQFPKQIITKYTGWMGDAISQGK